MRLLITALLALSPLVLSPLEALPAEHMDRATWAANATYHVNVSGRVDEVMALRLVRQLYTENPQANPVDVIAALNRLEKDFGSRLKVAAGEFTPGADSARELRDYLSVASNLLSLTPAKATAVVAGLIGPMASIAGSTYDSKLGPMVQITEQMKLSKAFEALGSAQLEEWSAAHELAGLSKEFALVINTYFGPKLRAMTQDSAAEIHAKNPEYSDHAAITNILSEVRSGKMSRAEAERLLKNLQQSMAELLKGRRAEIASIDRSQNRLEGATGKVSSPVDEQAVAAALQQRERDVLEAEAFRVGWNTLGGIIGVFDPKAGQFIQKAGTATFQVIDAFSRYSETAATFGKVSSTLGTLMASSNVLNAVVTLSSLFGGGASSDALILEQLRIVRKEIDQLGKDMQGRFDRIDQSLNDLHQEMVQRFDRLESYLGENIGKPIGQIQTSLSGIQGQLLDLTDRLDRLEMSLRQTSAELQLSDFRRKAYDCERFLSGKSRRLSEFKKCLADFQYYSTHGTLGEARNLPRSFHDDDLERELSRPIAENLSFLADYSNRQFSIMKFGHASTFPDFREWARGALAFASIYDANPEYWKVSGSEELDRLIRTGTEMRQMMRSSLTIATSEGLRADQAFLKALIGNYSAKLDGVARAMDKVRRNFEKDELKGYLLADSNPARLPAPQKLERCEYVPGVDPVEFPAKAMEMVPDTVRLAEHLIPGRLSFCLQPILERQRNEVTDKILTRDRLCDRYDDVNDARDNRYIVMRHPCRFRTTRVLSDLHIRVLAKYRAEGVKDGTFEVAGAVFPDLPEKIVQEVCDEQGRECSALSEPQVFTGKVPGYVASNWNANLAPALVYRQLPGSGSIWDPRQPLHLNQQELSSWERDSSELLDQLFRDKRFQMNFSLSSGRDLDYDVRKALIELTGAKKLIENFFTLNLPHSMSTNDLLVAYFHGSEGLLGSDIYGRAFSPPNKNASQWLWTFSKLIDVSRNRLESFSVFAASVMEERAGKEDHPLISEVLNRLTSLKRTRDASVPRRPISEARALVFAKIREIQRTASRVQ
jgi:hypothetical protein